MNPRPIHKARNLRFLIVLCIALAATAIGYKGYNMFTGSGPPILDGIDDSFYYFWLRSAVIDRDIDFTNDIELANTLDPHGKSNLLSGPRTETGYVPNKYWIGWALVNVIPFLPTYYGITLFSDHVTGFEPIFFVSIWIFQLTLAVLSLRFAWLLIGRFYDRRSSLVAVLIVWLASPLVYYQTARLSLVHNQLFFLITATYLLAYQIHDRRSNRLTWVLLGLTSSLAIVTRATAIVYLLFPAWVVLNDWRRSGWAGSATNTGLAIIGGSPPIILQLAAWKVIYGQYLVYSYGNESFDFTNPRIVAILFSDFHGFFNWHPFLLLGIGALIFTAFRAKDHRLLWVLSSLLIITINASWWLIWFGSSFGNRSFETLTFFAMAGTAFLLDPSRPASLRRGTLILGTIAILWNLQLLAGWFTHAYPRSAPVTFQERMIGLGALHTPKPVKASDLVQEPPD